MHVKYLREYLILGDVRISIDKNITYRNFKTNNQINDDRVIAELKTSINKDLDNLIEEFPIQRIRFSKYCFAIERLNCNNFVSLNCLLIFNLYLYYF